MSSKFTEWEHDPTDLDGQQERADARREHAKVVADNSDDDIVWLLSGLRGRRCVRRQLRDAGVSLGQIGSSFHSNYGQMCFQEGLRVRGLQLFSSITRLLASGEIPLESFQLLMKESDE
jgi:hypothetical protein